MRWAGGEKQREAQHQVQNIREEGEESFGLGGGHGEESGRFPVVVVVVVVRRNASWYFKCFTLSA